MTEIYYYSHARTALKYGMLALGLQPGDEVLIPDYICSVLIHPLEQIGVIPCYYNLQKDFTPDWSQLTMKVGVSTKALLMVNYFGQPQNISEFKDFCRVKGLYLIEDNAHGHGGVINSKPLGFFGDVGVSSPRKLFNISSGGILYINNEDIPKQITPRLPEYHATWQQVLSLQLSKSLPHTKHIIKKMVKSRPNFEDPYSFQEKVINDYCMDKISRKELVNLDIDTVQSEKYNAYLSWDIYLMNYNVQPVFKSLHPGAVPICYPVYVKNHTDAIDWFNWGWKFGYNVYSWPALPIDIINSDSDVLSRWKHLVCFSTDRFPKLK